MSKSTEINELEVLRASISRRIKEQQRHLKEVEAVIEELKKSKPKK